MGVTQRIAGIGTAGAAIALAPSVVVALLATRPKLAAVVFGGDPAPARHPSDLGLTAKEVTYAPGCTAWWIPSEDAEASVVIVHGFDTSDDPKASDPAPRLEMAEFLHAARMNTLVVSLGYATGAHLHSGGPLEADDIVAAVAWAAQSATVPVAILGCSAGGHASVIAARACDVFAVVTDSAFVSFAEVVADQGSEVLGAPPAVFGLVPAIMRLLTGRAPTNLEDGPRADVPMLHIHGDADTAIDHNNLARLAAVTGGEALTVAGADHIDSLRTDATRYTDTVVAFLRAALARGSVRH